MGRGLTVVGPMILLVSVAGCVIGPTINTRGEFVAAVKSGSVFMSDEHLTLDRPLKAVVADVAAFADTCLNVRVSRGPNGHTREAGGSTTYLPKLEAMTDGGSALSVQESYNDRQQEGAPPGGFFKLVAELRPAGKKKTQVDIYHNALGKVADPLKQWISGGKRSCPAW